MKYSFIFLAIIIYPTVFYHTINGFLLRILLPSTVSYENIVRTNEFISLFVYSFALISFIFFSLHSLSSYKKNIPWKFDLLLAIIMFVVGSLLSLKGFSYAALMILPLSVVILFVWLLVLKFLFHYTKYTKSKRVV